MILRLVPPRVVAIALGDGVNIATPPVQAQIAKKAK